VKAAERVLAALVTSQTTPTAIELLAGPEWDADEALAGLQRPVASPLLVVIGFEGTAAEVEYSIRQLLAEWRALEIEEPLIVCETTALWRRLIEFSAAGQSPLVLKASVVPSGLTTMIEAARELDPACSLQAHAGNGIALAKLSKFPAEGLSRALVGRLQPLAAAHHGQVIVLSNPSGAEMTHQSVWGATDSPLALMSEVKRRFDPRDILNRGRFVV
jgi:FAD/FMN-containing dehydrogenase